MRFVHAPCPATRKDPAEAGPCVTGELLPFQMADVSRTPLDSERTSQLDHHVSGPVSRPRGQGTPGQRRLGWSDEALIGRAILAAARASRSAETAHLR